MLLPERAIRTPALILTCSSLDGGARRRAFDTSRLRDYEFVEGLSPGEIPGHDPCGITLNPYSSGFGPKRWYPVLAAIAYGHYRLWHRVLAKGRVCFLFEDDIRLHSWVDYDALPYLTHRHRYPTPSLLTLWSSGISVRERADRHYDLILRSPGNSGALGYLLDPESAAFLIRHFPRIDVPIDHFILGLGLPECYRAYCCRKDRITHRRGPSLHYSQKERIDSANGT